jgi:uncharacterized protein YcfJ
MKQLILLSTAAFACGLGAAQEVGRVISATPIVQHVNSPRQVCTTEQVAAQPPKSGAGALMGAIAGGAMGNAIGGGAGTVAATVLGIVGGAAIGDQLEQGQTGQVRNVQRCVTQNSSGNKPLAYHVVYEFGGKQYSVQMPNDPGPTVQLQMTPVGSSPAMPVTANNGTDPGSVQAQAGYPIPIYTNSNYMLVEPVAYPVYYQANYLAPFALGFGMGYVGGYGGHGRGHRH